MIRMKKAEEKNFFASAFLFPRTGSGLAQIVQF